MEGSLLNTGGQLFIYLKNSGYIFYLNFFSEPESMILPNFLIVPVCMENIYSGQ